MTTLAILASSLLAPFFVEVSTEVRSQYQSLGKVLEDRPMSVTGARVGCDAGDFGRFGIRHWEVSSLTDRRSDVHRHALYHTEFGPTWQYDIPFGDDWRLKNDLTYSWSIYDGFENPDSNKAYQWVQAIQSLENPFVVPYSRLRRTFVGNDYIYVQFGFRRKCPVLSDFYVMPAVYFEGGNKRIWNRTLGKPKDRGSWTPGGIISMTMRLEAGWKVNDSLTVFGYVEQYEIVGGEARKANDALDYNCAHTDLTSGGIGVRLKF